MWVSEGIPGLNFKTQQPMNIQTSLPVFRSMSSFRNNDTSTLPEDYEEFLTKFPKSILLTFGTTFSPNKRQTNVLIDTIEAMPEVGFVVGLREDWFLY